MADRPQVETHECSLLPTVGIHIRRATGGAPGADFAKHGSHGSHDDAIHAVAQGIRPDSDVVQTLETSPDPSSRSLMVKEDYSG